MANQYLRLGRVDEAEALYRQVLTAEPDNVVAAAALGRLYAKQGKHALAIEHLRKAVDTDPDNVRALIALGNSLRDRGDLDRAKKIYRRVLELRPGHAEVLVILALLERTIEYNDDVRSLETLYQRRDLPRRVRRRLAFALGKIFDDLQAYDEAFGYLVEGNRIAREEHPPTVESEARGYERIKEVFDVDFFRRHQDTGMPDELPIIVTGMPRSGSSLVEQILASHPEVFGAGEVEFLRHVIEETARGLGTRYPIGFDALDHRVLRDMAARYVGQLAGVAMNERRIVDKNMGSIIYVGLIGAILPNVKIIHCQRDARDQGLSFFQHDFLELQPNSYDLGDIARYFAIRRDLMEHWERMLPGRLYTIQYEDLVADLESETRRLLEHCELPFDPACLTFHETERTVNTASLSQVRQPLYATSVGRWRNYEQHLQPLIAALEKASVELP